VPAGELRLSTHPMQEIVVDILAANLGLNAFGCISQSAGSFVSGFMAYHARGTTRCKPTRTIRPGASRAGTTSIGANDPRLLASGLPSGSPAILIYGATAAQLPFANGVRCVGSPVVRLGPIQPATQAGVLERAFDLAAPPLSSGPFAVAPDTTWRFQALHRDAAAGGAGADASNGVAVTFCP
jgi:hypothetical protein